MNCLIEWYLEPLKEETFLSGEDIERLFGNIQEIVQFQKLFLQSLEEAVEHEPGVDGDEETQFKVIVILMKIETILKIINAFTIYLAKFVKIASQDLLHCLQ